MSDTPDWNIPYVPENTLDPAAGLNIALERVDSAITESIEQHVAESDPHDQYEMRRQNNLSATTDPTVTDDETEGYEPLSKWINTATDEVWTCLDATEGAAVWALLTLDTSDLGTAALADVGDFATAAQGGLADSAVQPGDLADVATSGQAADVSIADAGDYYASADVEGALQEVGEMIGDIGTALDLINGEVI